MDFKMKHMEKYMANITLFLFVSMPNFTHKVVIVCCAVLKKHLRWSHFT